MRQICKDAIKTALVGAIGYISYNVDPQLSETIEIAFENENNELIRDVLHTISQNHKLAPIESIPLCQDTGSTVIFAELGTEVQIIGDSLLGICNSAVIEAQQKYCLRASIVSDPIFDRTNTMNNSPCILHIEHVQGDKLRLLVAQKGGGAENMSFLKMFNPTVNIDELISYVVERVVSAGSRPCPPLIIGIGIGGNFESCAVLAKKAVFEPLGRSNPDRNYAALEQSILSQINKLGCGVQGMGGDRTALAVHIKYAPCHIASLPVAVNIQCHAHRHIVVEL